MGPERLVFDGASVCFVAMSVCGAIAAEAPCRHIGFFKSKADLEKDLPHPEHRKFGASLKGLIGKVLVVDYVAKAAGWV